MKTKLLTLVATVAALLISYVSHQFDKEDRK